MPAFKERRDAFESRFAHDEALAFKAKARAARRTGLWVAQEIGLAAEQAETLAADLVENQVVRGDGSDFFETVRAQFAASGMPHSETWLRRQIQSIALQAASDTARDG